MRLKLIACDVFMREICHCVAVSPHVFDLDFTRKGEHDRPEVLHRALQDRIDATAAGPTSFDAVLLAFGLCGNATRGLTARTAPLVIPRAHDCCTIFLGSRERFREHFADNPSRPFSSAGYLERGDSWTRDGTTTVVSSDKYAEYVRLYGEENARYILETMEGANQAGHDGKVVYIDVPETSRPGYVERFRSRAIEDGKEPVVLKGDIGLIRRLIQGDWSPEEFLTVPPGASIRAVYDWELIVRAEEGAS